MEEKAKRSLIKLLNRWGEKVEGSSLPYPPVYDGPDVQLTGLVEHTDHVRPGVCFVARIRAGSDGHPFINEAIAKGAALIIGQKDPKELDCDIGSVPYLRVEDTGVAEAWLAAAWHNFPSQHLVMIGVTGTDGKSTTVNLIFQILLSAGFRVGMLSTIKAAIGEDEEPLALHVTTPEAPIIQSYLRRMVDARLTHCVLEATSHGLAQDRVGAIEFDLAIVTNITHEHLDYHGDFTAYLNAKIKLFKLLETVRLTPGPKISTMGDGLIGLGNKRRDKVENGEHRSNSANRAGFSKTAVINRDDDSYEYLIHVPVSHRITYGLGSDADIIADDIGYYSTSTTFNLSLPSTVETGKNSIPIKARMVGQFNVYNMLAAASAAFALGIDKEIIKSTLESIPVLPGRMQPIDRGQDFRIIVDFAHTPNALQKAISAARNLTTGRLIVVFGSAGKRDVQKRRMMAQIAARDADITVLTAEDPRTESLDEILAMMADGCSSQGAIENQDFWRIADRGQAIYFSVALANSGDLVLICGKGHEQSMCFGTTEYPWDDIEATRQAVDSYLAGKPMPDLGLPTFNTQ